MGKIKVYISMPITGYDLKERMAEAEIAKNAAKEHFGEDAEVVTPFDICEDLNLPYSKLMARDIQKIMESDTVVFCRGWKNSRGCRIERKVAEEMRMPMWEEWE